MMEEEAPGDVAVPGQITKTVPGGVGPALRSAERPGAVHDAERADVHAAERGAVREELFRPRGRRAEPVVEEPGHEGCAGQRRGDLSPGIPLRKGLCLTNRK